MSTVCEYLILEDMTFENNPDFGSDEYLLHFHMVFVPPLALVSSVFCSLYAFTGRGFHVYLLNHLPFLTEIYPQTNFNCFLELHMIILLFGLFCQ